MRVESKNNMHRDAGEWRHGGGIVPSALSKGGQGGQKCLSHNSIIGNFMVYQDRLESNSLQLFEHPENSEFCIIFIIFEVNIVDEQKKNIICNDFFAFCKFPLSSNLLLLSLPNRFPGVPEYACCVNTLYQNVGLQT